MFPDMENTSKKYRIFATDFDGTLNRQDDYVSDFTRETLREFIEGGGLFIIATGRMFDAVISRLPDFGLDKYDFPIISYNGGFAKMSMSGREFCRATFSRKTAAKILKYGEKAGLFGQTYSDGLIIGKDGSVFTKWYAGKFDMRYETVPDLSAYALASPAETEKIIFYTEDGVRPHIQKISAKFGDKAKFVASWTTLLEAIPIDSGKDVALEKVLKALGYRLDDCVAAGDNLNDLDMVAHAGFGVAVANAEPELKAVAKFVTAACGDDGVAKAIRQFCL